MRRDFGLVLIIAAAAFGIRTSPAWDAVYGSAGISFLETDAWYHVRLIENQVRNFPWRITLDPFAAPGGQFVPIAPLFDTLTSAAVIAIHGRDATAQQVEEVAAFMPPILGVLTVLAVWTLARRMFDRRAGLLAAALLAVLPGHFMDRTMLGFVDHHALEALLAMCVLLTFHVALTTDRLVNALAAGSALGAYLLAWGSGAFLVAILATWLALYATLARSSEHLARAARVAACAAVVALGLVLTFQTPAMHRYASQVLGVLGLGLLALLIVVLSARGGALLTRPVVLASVLGVGIMSAILVATFARDLVGQVLIDIGRLAPDPTRMGVLEARPLFLYSGNWNWAQPWLFFRTGFFIGAVALVPFTRRVWRDRAASDLLLWTFALATFVATVGQNRFGYYLVTACAVLGGWLATEILDWAGVPHAANPTPTPRTRLPLARELAVIAVAGGMFAPNLAPAVLLSERRSTYPTHWRETMTWLRDSTPPPFANHGPDFYYARYRGEPASPDYAVMSWWDQGYWIAQQARRVPVANPTQERAPNAARFYTATDEAAAAAILRRERVRYVISDYELPFRRIADGTIMGRFQTIVDWTGLDHDQFYEVVYRRDDGQWSPVWVFYEPYYRSMAFRLSALGGAGATPTATTVLTLATRVDSNGLRFREIVGQQSYATYDEARRAAEGRRDAVLAGLDPWQSAVPLEPLRSLTTVYTARTPEQQASEAPWLRVFEVK